VTADSTASLRDRIATVASEADCFDGLGPSAIADALLDLVQAEKAAAYEQAVARVCAFFGVKNVGWTNPYASSPGPADGKDPQR
jgi:hypothetical protein